MKKFLVKEFSPVVLFIISIVLCLLLTAFGLIHLVLKSIYHTVQVKFWKGPLYFIKFWLKVLYQLWNTIKFFFMQTAIAIDLFGNVTCGEAIEDCVTTTEKTMYGDGNITISTATGQLEYENKLNKIGIKFSKILSLLLDEDHCVQSYKRWKHNISFNSELINGKKSN